jgi:outer membrane protein assembly factor BamB
MFRHDVKHTGFSKFTGPPTPTLAWNVTVGNAIVSSAAIAADRTIYFGVGCYKNKIDDPHLYALHPDGSLKWKYKASKAFFSSPAIGLDNTLFITSLDGNLYAIEDMTSYGQLKWKKYLDYHFNLCSPAIGDDGSIFVGSPSFKYYQINPDGSTIWSYTTGWCIISSPAIDDDGTVYIGSKDHYLYAFTTKTPELKWSFATGEFYDGHLVDSSPAIGSDGTIYVGTDPYGAAGQEPVEVNTNFWAINPDGTLKWVFETEDGIESSPAIGPDGTIYFGSYDGYLYALSDNGTQGILKWKFPTNDSIDGSPVVDGDGVIYFGSRDATLYALYPNGSIKWIFKAEDSFEASPSIDGNGFLYIGSFDGNFYCLGTGKPDIGVSSIEGPYHIEPNTIYVPKATIRNYRSYTQNFTVTCVIDTNGTQVYSNTIATTLSGGSSILHNFTPFSVGSDFDIKYNVTVTTLLQTDENPDNNKLSVDLITALNNPPEKPKITGPLTGKPGVKYIYICSAADPDGDRLWYWIDWGDGSKGEWDGPYSSGASASMAHIWTVEGTYLVKVKARDENGAESIFSDPLTVNIPKNRKIINTLELQLLERLMERFPLLTRNLNLQSAN